MLKLTFWGTQGSYPSQIVDKGHYGSRTFCISVEASDHSVLIIDAGTGIIPCGKYLAKSERDIYLLLSHLHWDHIQGFPFFDPLYQDRNIYFVEEEGIPVREALLDQLDGVRFPVSASDLPAAMHDYSATCLLEATGVSVSSIRTHHPGVCYGYKLEYNGQKIAIFSDNQLDLNDADEFKSFVDFVSGVDILIHDAQFTMEDMPHKCDWGHSVWNDVCDLAIAADVKSLFFIHHDPARSATAIDQIVDSAQQYIKDAGATLKCQAASDGLQLLLD